MTPLRGLTAVAAAIAIPLGVVFTGHSFGSSLRTTEASASADAPARRLPAIYWTVSTPAQQLRAFERAGAASAALLPDLDQETPTDLQLEHVGSTWALGFRSAVRNIGLGPLIIEGHRSGAPALMTAEQYVVGADGSLQQVPSVGRLAYVVSPSHQHWHLLGFDRYTLRRAGSSDVVVADQKTGFCLGDRYAVTDRVLPNATRAEVYRTNCKKDLPSAIEVREGISVGWGDDYKAFLEGQSLPLTGLPDGRYVLVHRVNSDGALRELSQRNDAASVLFELHWQAGTPSIRVLASCPDRADCENQPTVRTVATGLEVPWDIAFLPDGSAFVTERPGRVRFLDASGNLQVEPVARIPVSTQGEGGLLGIALDPQFAANGDVYLYFTTAAGMRLERWQWTGSVLVRRALLVTDIQAGTVHDSGRIAFGPDGLLYIATGDAGKPALAQDMTSLNGKFLTLTPEQYRGTGIVRPSIVARGLRNPQGFDWQPGTGALVANDHGPSGFDGPEGFDEVDLIVPGGNYGWPNAIGVATGGGKYRAPLEVYRQPVAPSGATFLRQPSLWTGSYVLAGLRGQTLRRLEISDGRVVVDEALLTYEYGRLRTVKEGPGGCIYVLTSNRDGRGNPVAADDRILCVTPPH
jgi:glucose/arabinose dehydrogenase